METQELAGADGAGVKLCCSRASAGAACHGERDSESLSRHRNRRSRRSSAYGLDEEGTVVSSKARGSY